MRGIPYIERAIARTISPPGWYYDLITIHLYLRRDCAVGPAVERGFQSAHRRVDQTQAERN